MDIHIFGSFFSLFYVAQCRPPTYLLSCDVVNDDDEVDDADNDKRGERSTKHRPL